jgi:hypothetical protein
MSEVYSTAATIKARHAKTHLSKEVPSTRTKNSRGVAPLHPSSQSMQAGCHGTWFSGVPDCSTPLDAMSQTGS